MTSIRRPGTPRSIIHKNEKNYESKDDSESGSEDEIIGFRPPPGLYVRWGVGVIGRPCSLPASHPATSIIATNLDSIAIGTIPDSALEVDAHSDSE